MCCQPTGARWAQRVRNNFAAAAQLIQCTTEIHSVPERDRGGDEREPACTILLRFGRAIAQPAKAMEADRPGERVARLTLIELDGRLPPERRVPEPRNGSYITWPGRLLLAIERRMHSTGF